MNSKRGSVPFEADGGKYALRYSTNAIVEFQDETKLTLADGLATLRGGSIDFKMLRALLWAGLRDMDKSLAEAGDILDALGVQRTYECVQEAVSLAFPPPPEEEKDGDPGEDPGNAPAGKTPRKRKT